MSSLVILPRLQAQGMQRDIYEYLGERPDHREITLIELQSIVVFGCAALLFMVGATANTHDRIEGWDNFLFVYTE